MVDKVTIITPHEAEVNHEVVEVTKIFGYF